MKDLFLLDPSVTFLNFGSFGASPKPVFDEYIRWQRLLETEPVQFIAVHGPEYMKTSREALGKYIGCDADNLVYTPNPTFAMNIVAKNFALKPGDEILSTDIEYGAMDRTWNYYCDKAGAKFVRQHIRFPLQTKEDFIAQFWNGYSERTKAIFIGQITSATAFIIPVKEICEEAKRRGLITLVDGAHVPGHIPLNLREIDADFYTGACHKWMMTPKGSSFLFAKKEFHDSLEPLIISWGYEAEKPSQSKFLDYHQFNGTRDFSAYLCIPAAIKFMNDHDWPSVAARCRKLVRKWAKKYCEKLDVQPLVPITEEWLGQMFSLPIKTADPEKTQRHLFEKYRIEIPITRRGQELFLRFSVNAFNDESDLEKLDDALSELMQSGMIGKP